MSYVRAFAEDVAFDVGSVDVVVASMSLHYVADLLAVLRSVASWLKLGGVFVASMEHPVMTALAAQRWCDRGDGGSHWPVDDYAVEGPRSTTWFREGVVKHHRRIDTIVNSVIDAGLTLRRVLEPSADADVVLRRPDLASTRRRPPILVLRADRLDDHNSPTRR